MRTCRCGKSLEGKHYNRRYCSSSCADKARYAKHGARMTSEDRAAMYRKRCEKPGYREKLAEQGRARARKVCAFVRKYKLSQGCKQCGYAGHHAALEFHHVKGVKSLEVCLAKSISQAKSEIKKCVVLCSNCHRIETFNPRKPDIFDATYEEVDGT